MRLINLFIYTFDRYGLLLEVGGVILLSGSVILALLPQL
jgi:hypothetical protein